MEVPQVWNREMTDEDTHVNLGMLLAVAYDLLTLCLVEPNRVLLRKGEHQVLTPQWEKEKPEQKLCGTVPR